MKLHELRARINEERTPDKYYRHAIGQALAPNYYQGTVPPATILKRRKRNKIARASRKANRK